MKKIHLSLIVSIAILLLSTTAWGLLALYAEQETVPDGTVVDGTPIGGLAIDASLELLERQWTAFEEEELVVWANLGQEDRHSWTLAELGFRVEREPLVSELLALREGGLLQRARYRLLFPREHRMKLAWNSEQFEARIRQQWRWLEQYQPVDATRRITADDKIVYQRHRDAYRVDLPVLSEQVRESVIALWLHASAGEGQTAAKPPTSGGAAVLKLPIAVAQPTVTLGQLQAQGVERKIASHTTDYTSSPAGRAFNVEATARILQDWTLAPGEVFDYERVIAAAEREYGFREAPVILNGELVPGIGGGICQVSSTLYEAALQAGLEIVERRNHSLPVSYMPLGRDATFSEGTINFRFRNTTGKHLVIRTETKGRKLTIKLFGTLPDNVQYRITSKTVKTIDPPVREVSSELAAPGEPKQLRQGKPGYVVETYRTMLRDGKEVSRERISRDTYKASPSLVGLHPTDLKPDTRTQAPIAEEGLLEDGIRLVP